MIDETFSRLTDLGRFVSTFPDESIANVPRLLGRGTSHNEVGPLICDGGRPRVILRPVTYDDLELLLAWRSHPKLYRWFGAQDGPLEWESHVEWFTNRPPDREDWIIEFGGRRVGSVNVGADGDVGIYIGEITLWGQGVATSALQQVLTQTRKQLSELTARTHEDNEPTQRLFERVGFERVGRDGDRVLYEYRRDSRTET